MVNFLILIAVSFFLSTVGVMVWDRLSRQGRLRLIFGGMFLLTGAGLVFGIWAHLPFLKEGHARLEPWQAVLIWSADAAALFWFVVVAARYCASQLRQGQTTPSVTHSLSNPRLFFLGMLIPLALDVGVTVYLHKEDVADFRAAAVTLGEASRLEWEENRKNGMLRFYLRCGFTDSVGARHETRLMICTDSQVQIGGGLPAHLRDPLRRRDVPFPVRIAYLPHAPHRNWLADLSPSHASRMTSLHHLSLMLLFAQGFALLVVSVGLFSSVAPLFNAPWLRDAYRALPLTMEALMLSFNGMHEVWTWQ